MTCGPRTIGILDGMGPKATMLLQCKVMDAVQIPLLGMIDLAAQHAAETLGKGGYVGILASLAMRKTGVFERALERIEHFRDLARL